MIPAADCYAELGLRPGAPEADVRRAFRRLAFALHPDRNPDPEAAHSFRRVRAAYEALLAPAHREAVEAAAEAEEVVAAMTRAAEAAHRGRPQQAPRPERFTLRAGGFGLAPAVASRVAAGLAVSFGAAVVIAALAGDAALVVAGAGGLAVAPAAWATRRREAELRLYGDGFEDDRWPMAGRIGWGDVCALDVDRASGTLDLALTAPKAAGLVGLAGRGRPALVWAGEQAYYRLPLGDRLARVVAVAEARTGLRAR